MQARATGHRASWRTAAALALLLAMCASARPASAQQQPGQPGSASPTGAAASTTPPQLRDVTFVQRLGEQLPLDTPFRDEAGRDVTLGDYFGEKPVVLAFVYYQCPMLCTQVMNGISQAIRVLEFTPGQEFDIVLVSFDPRDTPAAAAAKKDEHLAYWDAAYQADSWHFLTGDEPAIRAVTAAAGFSYRWEERTQQFAHVSGVLTVTPAGRLSRYFYGVEYSPRDLRLALVESSENRIGSLVDELLLYCFHYDPEAGQYGPMVMNIMRLGALVTMSLLGGFVLVMVRRDWKAAKAARA
jgi:protein SCO1/2